MHLQALKVAIITGLLTFLTVLASSYVLYSYAIDAVESDIEEHLESAALAVSAQVDGDLHTSFVSRDQENSSEYIQQIAKLGAIKNSFPSIRYVYTCIMRNGEVYFVLDPTPPGIIVDGVETKSHIIDKYDEAKNTPALIEAFARRHKIVNSKPYTDRWGSFVSAYAPISNSKGEFVGVAAVDLDAKNYAAKVVRITQAEGICVAIGLFISCITSCIIYRQNARKLKIADNLARSEQRFQLAVVGSNNGIWDWDVVTNKAYFSPQFKRSLGYEAQELGDSFSEWKDRLHPDDKNEASNYWKHIL